MGLNLWKYIRKERNARRRKNNVSDSDIVVVSNVAKSRVQNIKDGGKTMAKEIKVDGKNVKEFAPSKDEIKEQLIKDYKNNATRLKKIPEELEMLEKNMEYTNRDNEMKTNETNLQIKDFELRKNHFVVKDIKFEWETVTEWVNVQKEILGIAVEKLKFQKELQEQSIRQNKINNEQQMNDVKAQRDRCMQAHKTVLKQLKDEHNVDIAELKKECTSPCCR